MKRRTPTNLAPLLGLLGLVACATTKPAAQTAPAAADTTRPATVAIPAGTPTEDLAKYRPVFTPPSASPVAGATAASPGATKSAPLVKVSAPVPTSQVNSQVEQRLRDQAYTNEKVRYTSGYRVRVYLGLERDQVMSIRRQIISRYPTETDYITFKQPVYRLYIGDYATKLDAARGLARLRPFAPKAELEPMQVLVNKAP